MKVKLPFVGEIRAGKDAEPTEIVKEVKVKEKFFDLLGGMLELGPNSLSNEKSISTKLLKANKGWVYRNNDAIAKEVSKLEFELYTVGLAAGEIVYNEVETHPLLDLLDKPNQETSKADAIYTIQSHRKLTGDAFWLKMRRGQQVVGLRALPPDKITLDLQTPTPEDPTVILDFHYMDTIDGQKIDVKYDPKDIIHFKTPNPNNAFRGYGTVEALSDAIDIDNLIEETAKKFFQNGALSNLVFTTDSKVTDEQLKRFKAEFKSTYGGVQNAFKAMVLGNGLKPSDMSYSNKDMQFLDQLAWYRDKIMAGFGNTKASLGMIDDVNRASHEGSIIEWQRNTVKPDMQAIVDILNEFLVPEFGANLVLGFCDPVPEDRSDDLDEATKLYSGNIIMRSEARELLGYESDESDMVYHDTLGGSNTPDSLDPNDNDEAVDEEVDDAKEDN